RRRNGDATSIGLWAGQRASMSTKWNAKSPPNALPKKREPGASARTWKAVWERRSKSRRLKANRIDRHWLEAAAALAARARPLSRPNPAVGAIVVRDGVVVGPGWTRAGGRPHAEAVALAQAGSAAAGATLYVTLEPCAHRGARGPACPDPRGGAGGARGVAGVGDPDPRTAGQGLERLRAAGIEVSCLDDEVCAAGLAGYLLAATAGRPHVSPKLALTADGFIARKVGTSKWITGEPAR